MNRRFAVLGALALAIVAHWAHAFRAPFINDDYVFLDRVRDAGFVSLWGTEHLMFGWWRPLSRELHYWTLQHLFGPHELPFHVASFLLAFGVIAVYLRLVYRLAGGRVAALAAAGAVALAAWAVPLTWIAGVQELWMLLFALLAVHAFAFGSAIVAALALAAALASKETAAVAPLVAAVVAWLGARMPVPRIAARMAPMAVVVIAWALIHPALGGRITGRTAPRAASVDTVASPLAAALEVDGERRAAPDEPARPGFASVVGRTLGVPLNLDHPLAPDHGWPPVALRALPALLLLAGVAAWATRPRSKRTAHVPSHANVLAARSRARAKERAGWLNAPVEAAPPSRPMLVVLGVAWALCGWLPLLWPSLGWHAYYALFGALGAWIALAALLAERRALAVAVIAALVVLRAAQAATPSLDWGSEWYQNRAATFLSFMRADLHRVRPAPPAHARLFFTGVPSNVGFITEGAPALRIWYRDTTLSGGFLSAYNAPPPGARGPDLFFRYDSTSGWVEMAPVARGAARPDLGSAEAWSRDRRDLGAAFARAGSWRAAAAEFAALARSGAPAPAAADAGIACAMAGDSAAAAQWFALAARDAGADDQIRRFARQFARYLR